MEYKLEAAKYDELKDHVAKVNKKFKEEIISLNQISSEFVRTEEGIDNIITFEMIFDTQVNDWKVVAKKTLEGNVTIVTTFTDEEIPDIRNHDFHCDHCHTSKAKKHLYLIHNIETNEYKYVGRACMQEFIGTSVRRFFSKERAINPFMDIISYTRDFSNKYNYISVKGFLSLALQLAMDGEEYINRNLANYENIKSSTDKVRTMMESNYEINPEVDKMIEWFISKNADNSQEFIKNVVEILKQEYVRDNLAAYITFVPFHYKKHLDYLKEKAAREAINSQMKDGYIPGKVGERITLTLKLLKSTYYEREATNYYDTGITYVYTFIDPEGRVVVWKTGKASYRKDECLNKTYTVTGTIKGFNEYNNRKQTILTRCKLTATQEKPF